MAGKATGKAGGAGKKGGKKTVRTPGTTAKTATPGKAGAAGRAGRWLVKTEPGDYSWDDLARDRRTVWDGVANNAALAHLRRMARGDLAIVYHTGDERAAVGVARVASAPYPDPADDDPRLTVCDLVPVKRLPRPVTLAEIKTDPAFAGWELVRVPRLSVMPVPAAIWERLMAMGGAS